MWRASEHTEPENRLWVHLRTIEWRCFPAFITIPILPFVFVFFPWWKVLLGLAAASLIWNLFCLPLVWAPLSDAAATFVIIGKWIGPVVACFLLALWGHYGLAVVALCWLWLAGAIGAIGAMFSPRGSSDVSSRLWRQIGGEQVAELDAVAQR